MSVVETFTGVAGECFGLNCLAVGFSAVVGKGGLFFSGCMGKRQGGGVEKVVKPCAP